MVSQPAPHNSICFLPVSQRAVEWMVEEHKKRPGNPYMFPSPKTGGMFDPDSFRHTHEKILKAIGAEHIRFHDASVIIGLSRQALAPQGVALI